MKTQWWKQDLHIFCDSVEKFMDGLVGWTADHIGESLELVEDPSYVGFQITWENAERPPSVTLWISRSVLEFGGAWGRALSTVEGRQFVASREEGSLYWSSSSPKYEAHGQVWFDP